uniref:C2H2-type domain-containing protein n=1 Tax=Megaselia scalaris TaxID=36166 RepID=T1GIY5_MEGSC
MFSCHRCDSTFTFRTNRDRHLRNQSCGRVDNSLPVFVCLNCSNVFLDENSWESHSSICVAGDSVSKQMTPQTLVLNTYQQQNSPLERSRSPTTQQRQKPAEAVVKLENYSNELAQSVLVVVMPRHEHCL